MYIDSKFARQIQASILSPSATMVIFIWLGCWPAYKSSPTADKHVSSLSHLFKIRRLEAWFNTVRPQLLIKSQCSKSGPVLISLQVISSSFQGYFPQWSEGTPLFFFFKKKQSCANMCVCLCACAIYTLGFLKLSDILGLTIPFWGHLG